MRKLATLLALLMVVGSIPGWCLIATVDNAVMDHTKDSSYRPVQDAGKAYDVLNKGMEKSFDKVPAVKMRPILFEPADAAAKETLKAGKLVINSSWDLLTLKKFRK